MTESSEEFRQRVEKIDNKFHEDFIKRSEPYRTRAFDYDKLNVEHAQQGFQSLTYLNGGALIAIPAAITAFNVVLPKADVLFTAGFFVTGLICVVLAQVATFFTLAKRGEANVAFITQQFHDVTALSHPKESQSASERRDAAEKARLKGRRRGQQSNSWRTVGIVFFSLSLIAFVIGCVFAADAILSATHISATKACP